MLALVLLFTIAFLCREDWYTQREIKYCFQIPTEAAVDCSNTVISAAVIVPVIIISRLNSILVLRMWNVITSLYSFSIQAVLYN